MGGWVKGAGGGSIWCEKFEGKNFHRLRSTCKFSLLKILLTGIVSIYIRQSICKLYQGIV